MSIRIPLALPALHSRSSALLEIFYSVPHMGSAAWSQLIACLRILALRIGYHCVARSPAIWPKSVGGSDTYGLRWNTTFQDMRFASWSVRFRSSGELTEGAEQINDLFRSQAVAQCGLTGEPSKWWTQSLSMAYYEAVASMVTLCYFSSFSHSPSY